MEPIKINLSKYLPELHVLEAYAEIYEITRVFKSSLGGIDKQLVKTPPQDVI